MPRFIILFLKFQEAARKIHVWMEDHVKIWEMRSTSVGVQKITVGTTVR